MKKIIIISIICFYAVSLYSQGIAQIKQAKEIVWFGLDFTKAKMIGTEAVDFTNPEQIVNHYFEAWNALIVSEPKKYNLELAVNSDIKYRIESVKEFNKQIEPKGLVTLDRNVLSEGDLQDIAKKYSDGTKGVGMLFAIENFNKLETKGNMYVVFFDIETGNVLHANLLTGVTGGFGFRNFWATTVYNSIKVLKKNYRKW